MEVRLNEQIGEQGLYATKEYKRDEIVYELKGEILENPTRESIRIGDKKHIIDEYGVYMNHSFEPTCEIKEGKIVALKDLNVGDELNFNYNDNEVDMSNPFYVNGICVNGKVK